MNDDTSARSFANRAWVAWFAVILVISARAWMCHAWMESNGFLDRPPWSDAGRYRLSAYRISNEMREVGVVAGIRYALQIRDRHPPLMMIATAMADQIYDFPMDSRHLWFTTLAFWVVFLLGIWRLASCFVPPGFAVVAVLVASYCPVIATEARAYWMQMPMSALVIWALLALVRSDGLTRTRWSLAAGALTGLAALTKGVAPIYVGGGVAFVLLHACVRGVGVRRALANAALFTAVAAALFGPWWVQHGDLLTAHAEYVAQHPRWSPPMWSLDRWSYYPRAIIVNGLGVLLAAVVVASTLGILIGRRFRLTLASGQLVVAAVIGTVVVTCGMTALEAHYVQCYVALGAIPVSVALHRLSGRHFRLAFAIVLCAVLAWNHWLVQRPFDEDRPTYHVAGVPLGPRTDHVFVVMARALRCDPRPGAEPWPRTDFVRFLHDNCNGRRARLTVMARDGLPFVYFDLRALTYHAEVAGVPVPKVVGVLPGVSDTALVRATLGSSDFLLFDGVAFKETEVLSSLRRQGFAPRVLERRRLTPILDLVLCRVL